MNRPSSLAEARQFIADVYSKAKGEIPPPPEEPLPSDCCERGCELCVFVVYYLALEEWRRNLAA